MILHDLCCFYTVLYLNVCLIVLILMYIKYNLFFRDIHALRLKMLLFLKKFLLKLAQMKMKPINRAHFQSCQDLFCTGFSL